MWVTKHKWRGRKTDPQSDPNKTAAGRWCKRRRLIFNPRQKNHLPAIVYLPLYSIAQHIKHISDKKPAGSPQKELVTFPSALPSSIAVLKPSPDLGTADSLQWDLSVHAAVQKVVLPYSFLPFSGPDM